MTGRERELTDMMERKNVDILCQQETQWKGSKARNIGGGCKLFYNGADGRRNGIRIVVREDLVEGNLDVKRVSERLMAIKLEVKGSILNIVSGYARQVNNSREEKLFLARSGWVDRKCIKTGEDSSRCRSKWTCGRIKHR